MRSFGLFPTSVLTCFCLFKSSTRIDAHHRSELSCRYAYSLFTVRVEVLDYWTSVVSYAPSVLEGNIFSRVWYRYLSHSVLDCNSNTYFVLHGRFKCSQRFFPLLSRKLSLPLYLIEIAYGITVFVSKGITLAMTLEFCFFPPLKCYRK